MINHFDELINRVDIEFEQFQDYYRTSEIYIPQTEDLWSESIEVVKYLKHDRIRTIDELKKAQEETYYYLILFINFFHLEFH